MKTMKLVLSLLLIVISSNSYADYQGDSVSAEGCMIRGRDNWDDQIVIDMSAYTSIERDGHVVKFKYYDKVKQKLWLSRSHMNDHRRDGGYEYVLKAFSACRTSLLFMR